MRNNIICATAFFVAISSVSAIAAVIRVPADQPTIQAGINAAGTRDTVLVAAGTYSEGLTVTKPIALMSENGADVTRLQSSGDVLLLNFIQLDTFRLIGFELLSTAGRGIASNFSKFRVEDCIFRHTHQSAIHFSGQRAVIKGNRFFETSASHGPAWDAIRSDNFGKTHLERNVFYGLSFPNAFATTSDEVFILNNTVVSCLGGFDVDNGSPGLLHNNVFDNVTGAAVLTSGSGPGIDYNLFNDCGTDVIGGITGVHSLFQPPLLTDPASGNFTPLPNSPVIDAGNPLYFDPDSTVSDIGAVYFPFLYPSAVEFRVVGEHRFRVVAENPVFAWRYIDTSGAQAQYELEIGADMDWSTAEMWNPGAVVSSDTEVVYAGLPLTDGALYHIRIRVNNGIEWGQWTYSSFRMNTPPSVPAIISPDAGQQTPQVATIFSWSNASDSENDPRTYEIQVYDDISLMDTSLQVADIGESPFTSSYGPVSIPGGQSKWWRCRSHDGYESSEWSSVAYFQAMPPMIRHVPGDHPSIQSAINAAGPGDTIMVGPGTYTENLDFQGKSISLTSELGPSATIIRPLVPDEDIINTTDVQECIIQGFTIRDVNYFSAVGINCSDCGLTIRDNYFTNNTEAAVWIHDGGSVVAEGNAFVANVSGGDAATLLCRGYSRAIVTGNTFRDNVSNWNGGGIHFSMGDYAEAKRNLVLRNGQSTDNGGGIFVSEVDTAIIVNNTIDSNHAHVGGGIYLTKIVRLSLQNNIVTRNFAYGIHADIGLVQIEQDYNDVWGNAGQDFSGSVLLPGTHTISMDPVYSDLIPSQFGRGISFGSPCMNSGNPEEEYDDPDGSRSDIGAFPFPLQLPFADRINAGSQVLDHIVPNSPRFYWTFVDTSGAPSGYEFEIGTDNDWTAAEQWQSGPVATGDTSALYGGAPLQDGGVYYARLRLSNGSNWGDWQPFDFRMNSRPSAPEIVSPQLWDTLHYQTIRSIISNSTDAEADSIQYEFEVYFEEELIGVADFQYVDQDSAQTKSEIWGMLTPNTPYWWRVRGIDGFEYSEWSSTGVFFARGPGQIQVEIGGQTLAEAFASAGEQDTVIVGPGEYYANIDFAGRSLTLLSESGATATTLRPADVLTSHILLGAPVGEDVEVAGFTFVGGNGASVIHLLGGSPHIHDNVFKGFNGPVATAAVLYVTWGTPLITRNVFMNNRGVSCIGIYEGDPIVVNNTFDRNRGGLHLVSGTAEVRNNIVTGSEEFGIYGVSLDADYNCVFQNNPNYQQFNGGPNDVVASPMYYDALSGDFRLQSGSPCINAGDPEPMYNDIDGSRNDMGAVAAVCDCACLSDPLCDHVTDLLDVIFVIGNAFRGLEEMNDDFCFSHSDGSVGGRTDVNCSGYTDIVDVVRIIDVAFRGADPSSILCASCDLP